MKDKILIFVIGLLAGAVITALGFLICEKVNKNTNQIPRGEKIQMMERNNKETSKGLPSGTKNDENRPEHPSTNNSSTKNEKNKEE